MTIHRDGAARLVIEKFYRTLDRRVTLEIEGWESAPLDSIPLAESHRLLSFEIIKSAWLEDLLNLCRPNRGGFVFSWPPRDSEDNFIFTAFHDIKPQLRQAILSALKNGAMTASGLISGSEIKGKPSVIPPDRWSILAPDFNNSSASVDGKVVLRGITVSRSPAIAMPQARKPKGDFSKWALELKKSGGHPVLREFVKEANNLFGVTRDPARQKHRELWPDRKRGPRGSAE